MTDYKLVAVEPTREMWAAAGDALVALNSQHHDAISEAVYRAMLAASPAVHGEPVAEVVWPDVEGRRGGFRQFGQYSSPRLPAGTKLYTALPVAT